jgi:hypothetical protein
MFSASALAALIGMMLMIWKLRSQLRDTKMLNSNPV